MLLALVMTFLGTTNVSAGWIQKFTDQGVDKDYNILFVDGADVKINEVDFAPVYHNDGTTDWYFNSNFLIQKGTKWLMRPTGLYQFNGGNRQFAAAVTKGQVITIEASGDPNPISNCTLKSQSGNTYTYTANDDGYAVFSPARYLYFYKISVEEPAVGEVNYTVKYMCGTTEVKPSVTRSGAVDAAITLLESDKESIFGTEKGYGYTSDDSGSKTIAADGSTVVTVSFRELGWVGALLNEKIGDQSVKMVVVPGYESQLVSVPFHQYLLFDYTLYEAPAEGNQYNRVFTIPAESSIQDVEHTATSYTNVVYFSEAEDIEGLTKSNSYNADIRCSNGYGAYNASPDAVILTSLPAGTYKISAQVWGGAGETLKVILGTNVFECPTTGSRQAYTSDEFTITETTNLIIPTCGNNGRVFDWVFVQKTDWEDTRKEITFPTSELLTNLLSIKKNVGDVINRETIYNHLQEIKEKAGLSELVEIVKFVSDLSGFISHLKEKYTLLDILGLIDIEVRGADLSIIDFDLEDRSIEFLKEGSTNIKIRFLGDEFYKAFEYSLNLQVNPHVAKVVDITVAPEAGTDIAEAVAAEAKKVTDKKDIVGNITINLDGAASSTNPYTIKSSIVANKAVVINGDIALIDASGLTQPFIAFNSEPTIEAVESGQYVIEDQILIDKVVVDGMTKALFADNGKSYAYKTLSVRNSVFHYTTQGNVVFNFANSMAINMDIINSTFYSDAPGTANFIAMSGKRPWQITGYESETGKFLCDQNTFYNVAKSKQFFNTNSLKGQKYLYEFNSNIFVDVSNKKIYGNMTNNKNQLTTNGLNTYMWEGKFFSEANYNGDEGLKTDPSFKDPAGGNDADFAVPEKSEQAHNCTGHLVWGTYSSLEVKIAETANGTVKASKQYPQEGEEITLTVTPAEGYELESLTVKDAGDAEVTVTDNKFTMPATDVTVTATFKKLPVDVNITVESGNDIAAAVETAADGAPIKSINVTLEEGGTYTIGKSLSAQGNVIINGNGATIDASALTTPFVQMADLPTEGLNDKGAYEIDEVSFNDVTITGLPYQLFYANKQKYLITTLKVDNSVIGINGSKNKTIFDFNSGGNCLNLTVNNSTLWANPSNAQNGGFYSSQSGQSVQDLKDGAEQVTTISNSTIYNIASGKTTSTRRKNSQDWIKYVVTNSIIAESGKSGQFLKGLNAGQAGKDAEWTVDGNTFIFGGAVIEEQNVGSSAENIQNSLTSDPEFADAANGDFTVGESTEQAELETGDPRWLVEFVGGEGDATDLLAEIEEAKKLLKFSMPYYDENNEESPETEGKALVDAIRDAEEKVESGATQKKLDKALEDLVQAEIDYTTALMDYELAESEAILAGADPADELAAEIQRLYDTQDVVREDYSNQPKHIKNYADEIDKAQKAYLRKAINELIPEAQAMADSPEVKNALDKANEALEGDSSEDLFDALNGLLEAMETATGIRGIEANDTDDAPVYNMGGQRVSSHAKGIVIKNGKKIIRK